MNAMTREQFRSFVRALIATLLAGLVLWLFNRIGVQLQLPAVQPVAP